MKITLDAVIYLISFSMNKNLEYLLLIKHENTLKNMVYIYIKKNFLMCTLDPKNLSKTYKSDSSNEIKDSRKEDHNSIGNSLGEEQDIENKPHISEVPEKPIEVYVTLKSNQYNQNYSLHEPIVK